MNEENNDTLKTHNTVPLSSVVSDINKVIAHRLSSDDEKTHQYSTSLPLYYYNDERVSRICTLSFHTFIEFYMIFDTVISSRRQTDS